MKYLERDTALKLWDIFWNETSVEFFKVEAVQDYSAEDNLQSPSYVAWVQGDKDRSIALIQKNAKVWAKQTHEKPILKRRVRIVEEPYGPYLKWQTHTITIVAAWKAWNFMTKEKISASSFS